MGFYQWVFPARHAKLPIAGGFMSRKTEPRMDDDWGYPHDCGNPQIVKQWGNKLDDSMIWIVPHLPGEGCWILCQLPLLLLLLLLLLAGPQLR